MNSIGLDIGSTTIKYVVMNEENIILKKDYLRHNANVGLKAEEILSSLMSEFGNNCFLTITGSASMGIAKYCKIPFIQEVYSEKIAVDKFMPNTDVIIELGGEDAKIIFISNGLEVRMNGTCAGGTGSFIDQMASLLDLNNFELNDYASRATKIYQIASRCGVFAKSDIQPLINQGALKEDLAKSIYYAICNQTIGGLAQGREIKGKILYLGGPLTFNNELRNCFDSTLKLQGVCPENSLYYVAIGAALTRQSVVNLKDVITLLKEYQLKSNYNFSEALFNNEKEYQEFNERHQKNFINTNDINLYTGNAYLGIDSGSTTIKIVLIDEDNNLLFSKYVSNKGQIVEVIKNTLLDIYEKYPHISIKASASTGYGEQLVKNAFQCDFGVVETIAHYTGASYFMPNVDFIIDIGGQDIKCFKIKNGSIDSIFLNESCSSGCGSFLQTFANTLGYEIEDFAKIGLFAEKPVDLGSRCTVFMNSLVKEAQKSGATIDSISAGLSKSVVKNALYKVIRIANLEELGKNIVVQGGTFLNDSVLRAFEQETKLNVVRPNIAGLMGAFGAALFAKNKINNKNTKLISYEDLKKINVTVKNTRCNGCSNNCKLTINDFGIGRRYISGNNCEKPITNKSQSNNYNLYEIKRNLMMKYRQNKVVENKQNIGIPLVLNNYDLLPFWYTVFTTLGFNVVVSSNSTQKLYLKGQSSIPSDTICYPAKLVHGHIIDLKEQGVDTIFYPTMTKNIDEGLGDKNFNCPVVAYYPEVIKVNMDILKEIDYFSPCIGIDQSHFTKKFYNILKSKYSNIKYRDLIHAINKGFEEYRSFQTKLDIETQRIIDEANLQNKQIIVLAGRPYHLDGKICHEIDKLIISLGAFVVSEESIARRSFKQNTSIINQWTYHSRLYAAANYIKDYPNMNMIQLVSFGCGIDAITTDEVKEILERNKKIYTQIKIDEMTNLGAAKIRIRSLLSVVGDNYE